MVKPNIGQGDKGEAFVFGSGKRFPKDSAQFEAVGTVDELNSMIGFAWALNSRKEVRRLLAHIQGTLFIVQSHLGTEEGYERDKRIPSLTKRHVRFLERQLIVLERDLPELKNFIVPAGVPQSALLHACRAVARRAERRIVTLSREKKKLNPNAQAYVNRLSDVLFALARYVQWREGGKEIPWIASAKD